MKICETRNDLYNYITAHVAEAVMCGFSRYKSFDIYSHHGRLSVIHNEQETFFASTDEVIYFIYQEQQLAC